MTTRPANPNLPPGVDEADLLALVEGETLPGDRAAAVTRVLAANPACARLVEAMKRDRAAMRAMGEAQAPAGLMESVESALQQVLERQMLIGLSEGDAISDRPPVSIVVPARRPSGARKMAMAAGVLLLLGGGVFTAMTVLNGGGGPGPRPIGPVAKNDEPSKPDTVLARTGDTTPASADRAAPSESTPTIEPAPATIAEAPVNLDPAKFDSMYGPPVPGEIDSARAVALAAEHRLVIRVTPPDGRIGRITDRLAAVKRPGWQYSGAAPTALASAVDPDFGHSPVAPERNGPPTLASGREGAPTIDLNEIGPPRPTPPLPEPTPTVYMVSARLDEASLEGVCTTLRETGADVIFEESPEPLPIDAGPVTTASAVLWWGGGPSGWTAWGSVPVMIRH